MILERQCSACSGEKTHSSTLNCSFSPDSSEKKEKATMADRRCEGDYLLSVNMGKIV